MQLIFNTILSALFFFFLSASFVFSQEKIPDELHLHVLDVGMGDSILMVTPTGETALVDTGYPETAPKILKKLEEQDIATLHHLIVTHLDADHMGGTAAILDVRRVLYTYDNGQNLSHARAPAETVSAYENKFRNREGYQPLRAGDEIAFGEAVMKVLWPPQEGWDSDDPNENSLVIKVSFGDAVILLAGDLMIRSEAELLKNDEVLKADLLKVGHHGSRYASSEAFLDQVRPKIAIISTGKDVPGKPNPLTLNKLKSRGIKVARTDLEGSVLFAITKEGTIQKR